MLFPIKILFEGSCLWNEGSLLQGLGGFVQLLELSCISSPIPRHYPQSHASLFIPHRSHHLLPAFLSAPTLKGHCFCVCSPSGAVGISVVGAVSFIHHGAYPGMVGTQYCKCITYLNGWKIEKTARHRKFNPVRNNKPSVDFLIIILTASCFYLSASSLRP